MDNQAKATPRPWIQSEFYDWCITDKKHHEEEDNDWYAVECFGDTKAERKANVSLVLKCVNNHEALLEACRIAQDLTDKWKRSEHGADFLEVDKVLRKAIANATK